MFQGLNIHMWLVATILDHMALKFTFPFVCLPHPNPAPIPPGMQAM